MLLRHTLWPALMCIGSLAVATGLPTPVPADGQRAAQEDAAAHDGLWNQVRGGNGNYQVRELYGYALALCEANMHLDRVPKLLEAASEMQETDPDSPTYGNFRWYRDKADIVDTNAVEFSMRHAAPIWIRHRDKLPEETQALLRETLERGVHGCLKHWVPLSYTNIGFMRSANLIMLGEALQQPKTAEAGYRFLDGVIDYTRRYGIHEYVSPTYHGVAMNCLYLLETMAQTERVRRQAQTMLELFWSDIALNWLPGAERLAGTYSRTYRYVNGGGSTTNILEAAGWLDPGRAGGVEVAFVNWQPPLRLWELTNTRFPRLVRQSWGPAEVESRTAYLCRDIALSTSGALYHVMDQPLTVDFATRPNMPRAYFIADGRNDPYGTSEIPSGGHQKAEHLACSWLAAQRGPDALAAAYYRDIHWDAAAQTLQSHFVMPRDVDGIWIGDQPVDLAAAPPWEVSVPPDAAVTVRSGAAAMGLRLLLSRGLHGAQAPIHLVHDGNNFGVVRLSIMHAAPDAAAPETTKPEPGAVFWIRIGSGLDSEGAFHDWRAAFAKARADYAEADGRVRARVSGVEGPVAIAAEAPAYHITNLTPHPTSAILELDGAGFATPILSELPPKLETAKVARHE